MNEPKIRFQGFEGEWKEKKLGDFGHVAMCKRIFKNQTNPSKGIPFYKIGTFGQAPDAFISELLYKEYKCLYSFPHIGDILLSAAGTIGRTVEYNGEDAYFQDSNIVWLEHDDRLSNKFLKHLYSKIKWSSLEGATIKRLYNSNILETSCYLPSAAEQQAIASYFTHLDTLITTSASRLASLKQMKAASLQAMFPQEGETVPKIRFKGFEGEWEKMKLGDMCINKLSTHSENDLGKNIGKYPIYGATGYIQNIESYDMEVPYVSIIKDGSGVGRVQLYPALSSILGTMQYLIPYDETDVVFLFHLLEIVNFTSFVNGSSIPHIYYKDYSKIEVVRPSLPEQQAIASYFTSLDKQISLQSQRLEKLKQIKAACLDQMFV